MDGSELTGQLGKDRVCPVSDDNSCTTDFQFIALSDAGGLDAHEDGVVGLWSGNETGLDTTEMIMHKLAADTGITEQTFSFYLGG